MVCSQDIWSSKECSGNQLKQNMQKKSFEYKSKHHRDSAIRIWLFKNGFKIRSNNVICEAKAAFHHRLWDWKWNNRFHCSWEAKNLASTPTVHIYCSCNRIETFSFQLSSMTTKCVNVCSRTLANGQIKRRISLVMMFTIYKLLQSWSRKRGETFLLGQLMEKGNKTGCFHAHNTCNIYVVVQFFFPLIKTFTSLCFKLIIIHYHTPKHEPQKLQGYCHVSLYSVVKG